MPASAGGALLEAAQRIGVSPGWLAALIDFETGGTWDPYVRNPRSSARGLLQWLDATAQGLGYSSSLDLVQSHPTVEAQLTGPVVAYLAPLGPFPSFQSLALAVFYPAYRDRPASTEFPPQVQAANPGIRTVGDYVALVSARLGPLPIAVTPGGSWPAWVLVAGAAGVLLLLVLILR